MATVNFIKYGKQSRGTLSGVKQYVEQEIKTLDPDTGMRLISGQNCSPQFADREFTATRNMYRKKSPVWFYHYTQSFHPDEPITGVTAHEIAKEFAAQVWPDSEVLIATHIDAAHIHSHFIVNAVCHESGMMLRQGPSTLSRLRNISDGICQAHGLTVLKTQQQNANQGMASREYRSAAKGQSWKFKLMNTIDECMRYARSRDEFIALLRSEGYDVRWTDSRKNITYTTPEGMKCRDDRLHSEKYLKENMEYELRIREEIILGGTEAAQPTADGTVTSGATSDRGKLDDAVASDRRTDTVRSGTDRGFVDAFQEAGILNHPDANRENGAGFGGNTGDAQTGWEEERAALFLAGDRLNQEVPGMAAADPDRGGPHCGVVQLGHALERLQDTHAVSDSTTMGSHADSKTLRKQQKKKIALGHKPDDHEDEQAWKQTM